MSIKISIGWAFVSLLLLFSCGKIKKIPDDTVVVLVEAEIGEIDPRFAVSAYGVKISRLIFSSLISFDSKNSSPVNDIAERVERTDGRTWAIYLKKNYRFADGVEITSETIEKTINLYRKKTGKISPYGQKWDDVARIKKIGKYVLEIILKKPRPSFVTDLDLPVLPVHDINKGLGKTSMYGSGPFYLESKKTNQVVLIRNPYYYNGVPRVKKIIIKSILEENVRALMMISGYADISQNNISPLIIKGLKEKSVNITYSPGITMTYIGYQLSNKYLSNSRVRKALSMAIDRKGLIKNRFNEHAKIADSVMPPHNSVHCSGNIIDYDPEKAAQILDSEGFKKNSGGWRFEIEYKTSSNPFRLAIAKVIARQWAKIGVKVRLRSLEWGVFYHDVRARQFDVITLQLPEIISPFIMKEFFHSKNIPENASSPGYNRWGFSNSEFDQISESAFNSTSEEKRLKFFCSMQNIIRDQLPVFPLWYEDNTAVTSKRIKNYTLYPNARFSSLSRVEFSEKRLK
ncbi:MAG: ABC transporter substrate-binding protein [Deltaproteobacteria bacterium]|nr:ABC transporter substrate-binding protein [Deltaproteobacteria bacterium]